MKEVVLRNRAAFEDILAHYEISDHGKKVLHDVRYVVLLAVTAGGRNTIIRQLLKSGKYKQVISDTTRPPKLRDGKMEEHGVNYYFREEEDLLQELKDGEFLEAELIHNQQVSGTSIRELEAIAESGKIGINEIDFGGTKNLLEAKPDTDAFAIFPPSYDEWQSRFKNREKITDREYMNRLNTALKIIKTVRADERIKVVINDDYVGAAQMIDSIIDGHVETAHEHEAVELMLHNYEENIKAELKRVI